MKNVKDKILKNNKVMIYSDDYQNVQKLFDELTVYDQILFLKKNLHLYIDEVEELDIEEIAKEMGMVYESELTIEDLLDLLEDRTLKEKHINVLKNIILNYDIKKEVKPF